MSRKRSGKKTSGEYHYNDLTQNPVYGLFGEESCVPEGYQATEEELLEANDEIRSMIEYDIERGDMESVASWRRMLTANINELRQLRRARTA